MIRWHGSWSEEHPVAGRPEGSGLPLFLSIDDAVERAYSAFFGDVPSREWIRERLLDGQPVEGFRLIRKGER